MGRLKGRCGGRVIVMALKEQGWLHMEYREEGLGKMCILAVVVKSFHILTSERMYLYISLAHRFTWYTVNCISGDY
jgi:hypothetical protein